jgi:hypothetical protein
MIEKCSQCKSALQTVLFDVSYGVNVKSLHCGKCGFNRTEDNKLRRALNSLRSIDKDLLSELVDGLKDIEEGRVKPWD